MLKKMPKKAKTNLEQRINKTWEKKISKLSIWNKDLPLANKKEIKGIGPSIPPNSFSSKNQR